MQTRSRLHTPARLLATLLGISALAFVSSAAAATEPAAAFITWQTVVDAPNTYAGKLIPNRTSAINVAVFALRGGAPATLASAPIQWYVNNTAVASGIGLTTLTLPPNLSADETLALRVVIKEVTPDDLIAKTTIHRRGPKTVLTVLPGPLRSEQLAIQATPFFFTQTADHRLEYRWHVGGQIRSVINDIIVLDTTAANINQFVYVTANTSNPSNPLEAATTELTLRIP